MYKFLLLSLKSRNEIYSYSTFLKNNGLFISIISSPKSLGSTCQLIIKTDYRHLNKIINLLNNYRPKSFMGLYSVIEQQNGNLISKVM